jgi:glucose-1-phosphate cytidylyltransferase
MKAVILAGGLGTRLSEETSLKPKPMVEIGGKPIIWHIMKLYSHFGINDFIICLGYKGYIVKEYFSNYLLHMSNVHIDLDKNKLSFEKTNGEPWRISLINTGEHTMTGGRIKRIKEYIGDDNYFFLTYGDGLVDVNISKILKCHLKSGKLATMTCVQPAGRFGAVNIQNNLITTFQEKPEGQDGLINGGFFVLSPKIFDYIDGDNTLWEQEPLRALASDGELNPFIHKGFWQPMDTLREKNILDGLWKKQEAPWKVW